MAVLWFQLASLSESTSSCLLQHLSSATNTVTAVTQSLCEAPALFSSVVPLISVKLIRDTSLKLILQWRHKLNDRTWLPQLHGMINATVGNDMYQFDFQQLFHPLDKPLPILTVKAYNVV